MVGAWVSGVLLLLGPRGAPRVSRAHSVNLKHESGNLKRRKRENKLQGDFDLRKSTKVSKTKEPGGQGRRPGSLSSRVPGILFTEIPIFEVDALASKAQVSHLHYKKEKTQRQGFHYAYLNVGLFSSRFIAT